MEPTHNSTGRKYKTLIESFSMIWDHLSCILVEVRFRLYFVITWQPKAELSRPNTKKKDINLYINTEINITWDTHKNNYKQSKNPTALVSLDLSKVKKTQKHDNLPIVPNVPNVPTG